MKRQILISSIILLSIQTLVSAVNRYVPSRDYPTIQSGINAANPVTNDVVIVAPGVYAGTGNINLDFGGKAITVRSQINPANPNPAIIAATIIDCGGQPAAPTTGGPAAANRAFWFHTHEGFNSMVMGFTIRNGYARGIKGADGQYGYDGDPCSSFRPIPPCDDPCVCPPYALNGSDVTGDGYGGAILCENVSSPTIMHCVIKDCTVTGAHGGNGADGLSGTWYHWTLVDFNAVTGVRDPNAEITENTDGQWGGRGGIGSGNGCGGAIACRNSSPMINNCTISDNFARGGRGGDGGKGGDAASTGTPPTYEGSESGGGDANDSIGDGIGGGIYCDNASSPTITNCTFSNNVATTGPRGTGGQRGLGTEADPRTPVGNNGLVYSAGGVAGGAAFYMHPSNAVFLDCTFTGNKAYEAYIYYNPYLSEDIWRYTIGGALYSDTFNVVNLYTCNFINNKGGAVFCDFGCVVNINTLDPADRCSFSGNSDTADGGAVYIEAGSTVNLQNCIFGGNSAYDDGGALECRSNATITNCSFGNNKADSDNDGWGYGGAMDAYRPGTTLTINANACSFSGNQAIYGGGFSSENFNATFTNCYFIGNTAHDGGGLDLVNGNISVTGGVVKGNNAADGDGGGFDCWYTIADINNCTISDNSADGAYPTSGNGGAINFYGEAPTQKVFNCLITGNSAAVDGGAIFCNYASPSIGNCTFSGDSAAGYGGAIFADWGSSPQITDCIFKGCNNHAIHEEVFGGDAIVRYSLFYNNAGGDYYDSGTGLTYTGAGQIGSIPNSGGTNLYGNPLFVSGPLGNFYLNQTSSPAINSGSATAAFLGLNTYTTDANNAFDLGQVDRGYHYPISASVQTFHLTASVVGGHGMVVPTSPEPVDYNSATDIYTYYAGTIVTLTTIPDGGWRIKAWSGTDDDSSTAKTKTVVMNSDKSVTVEFKQGRTLIVAAGGGQPGYYSNIQDAVGDANDGDTIVVYPGIYNGGYFGVSAYVDKSVTITSVHPDDPCCVAATIIDGYRQSPFNEGYTNIGVVFGPHTNTDTIFDGFTVQNCGGHVGNGIDGDRSRNHPNGYDGGSGYGAAIRVNSGGGPVIKNCIIRNNVIIGGSGGNGVAADTTHNAGRGGWGGYAYGGAIYCDVNSSWTFINCQIIDNYVQGGTGGTGGNELLNGGFANYGGNWSITGTPEYPAYDINPGSLDITSVSDGGLWERWGYIGDYRWYSAYGGGVFCDAGSTVTFIHCTISGNRTIGGVSGQGGQQTPVPRPLEPLIPYELPTFGGGVYCAAESTVTFTDCTITNNLASEPNQNNNRLDPYLGHGGGVCAEDTAKLTFTNCTFSENTANVGGGTHFANANPTISDCNFVSNSAFQGGGLFGVHGPVRITGCNIISNEATSNDPNIVILGNGGGLHLWATETNIIDCNISGNQAENSGGGVFFGGENASSLTNCLLTKNTARRDGGAISTSIFAQLTISNCTIVGNTGITYGGGLNCSYGSYANIINSIIWSNAGIHGSQIAVGTGFEYDERPSTVDISYSDVGVPPYEYSAPIDPNRLPVIRAGFDDNNLPANDDESTGLVDIGFTLNLFGIETSELYVNNNGNVTFDANMMTFTPFGLTGDIGMPIIAPFFADVDTRATDSNLATYGTGTVNGRPAFGVNWLNVGYFNTHADKLNNFQLIIIDRSDRAPGDFDIEFNYETLNWETGDASGGTNGFGGQSARAGFSSGTGEPGTFYEFEGSGVSRAFLDSSTTGLIHGGRESSVPGRYIFVVKNGLPEILTSLPFYVDTNCVLSGFDPSNGTNSWDPNSNLRNISKNPNFIGGYLLSQIAAGQEVDSPSADGWASLNGGTTGGTGGTTVTVSTAADFKTYVESTSTYIVQVSGTIDLGSVGGGVEITSNKTIRGLSSSSTIIGRLGFVDDSSNIIIQGLNITNPSYAEADGISMKTRITNVFITNCTFYDCGDGCLDITNESDFVTVSWCKFYYTFNSGHNFVNLIGSSDTHFTDRGTLRVTMHHNWWSTMCKERMPRVRFGQVHVYNNYYGCSGNGYCVGVGVESQIRLENNYFDNVNNSWKDYSSGGIPGIIGWNSDNQFMNGTTIPTWATNDYATIFTPPYSYTLDAGAEVKSIVMAGAGNIGGDSPCVDAGSDLASVFGLHTYTTRTDSFPDTYDPNNPDPNSVIVDMGYHYSLFTPPQYRLDINAVGPTIISPASNPSEWFWYTMVHLRVSDPPAGYQVLWTGTDNDTLIGTENTVLMDRARTVTVTLVKNICELTTEVVGGNGTITPTSGTYARGTVVTLTADPCEGYRVAQWTDTDNDASYTRTNTVTMNGDKHVTVEFEQPQTITVPGNYVDIQSAIGAARPGDIVKVESGVYHGSHIVVNKEITIASTHPDDPCVVAATIIDSSGYADTAVVFYTGATQNTVFDGFTIIGGTYNPIDAPDTNAAGQNGFDGYSIGGGAMYVYNGTSPTIKNCVITDTNITGGNASDGGNADAAVPAGRGGWAGGSYGGGIYIDSDANPTLINCTITNCVVRGGNAGNGGNSSGTYSSPDYRDANHGGSWSNDETFPWQSLVGSNGQPYLGDYWYYSGLGGGVFCAPNSSATFIACNITNNTAFGGMSGIGGTRPWVRPDPVIAYRIPSFGGGVFCANDTNVRFIDCNITGNTSPRPDETYHIDPYLGHGGGIAFSQTAYIEFTNCNIADNNAAVGGGMYWTSSDPQLFDCNIAGNVAYVGGGIYGAESTSLFKGCTFSGNFAGVSPNDVDTNAIGQGGGIYSASMESQITDCTIIDNNAATSGGGIFFSGAEASTPMVKNCLVVDNQAGRDGGGLSVNWYAAPLITNCTIVGNEATGDFGIPGETGLGGGIYSGYHSHPVILNSILWNNYALRGKELAVGTGFEYDPRPSTVDVNHSDIKGAQANAFVDVGCTLNWGAGNIYADPCFVTGPLGDYYLSQTDTNDHNQTTNSPCVDKGNDLASSVGLYILYTTRTDEVFDTNIVDMGYHYPLAHPMELCSFSDLSHDGIINFVDFAIFCLHWLDEGCLDSNGWCGGADLTFDTHVNFSDLSAFYECWLAEDTNAPVPNPSEWEIKPYSTTTPPYTIRMTAEAAFDSWGGVVKYYFECVTGNDSNSGWDPNRTYIRTSLNRGTVYGYRVKARDERGNETLWSVAGYVIAGEEPPPVEDHNAPTPNPMTWATLPHATSSTSIAMTATTATDDTAGVQYYFEDFDNPDVNSGWLSNPSWVDTTCEPETTYTYRVKARDTSFWWNETGWSDPCSATTPATPPPPDTTKPTPNPSQWAAGGEPIYYWAYYEGGGYMCYWHTMTAELTTDDSGGPVQYYFEVRNGCVGTQSSGWQLSNTYNYPVSVNPLQYGEYRVKAKDAAGNETTPSGWTAITPSP